MTDLQQQIRGIRRHLRWQVILNGLSWAIGLALAVVLTAAVVDALVHINHPGLRFALLLGAIALAAIAILLRVLRPLTAPWDDVSISLLIERLDPDQRDRLASAVQFDQHGLAALPANPSASLVHESVIRLRSFSLRNVLNRRRQLFSIGLPLILLIATFIWYIAAPATASLAIRRQLTPYSAPNWPRLTALALLDADLQPLNDPPQLVAGESITLYVTNLRGSLPEDIQIEHLPPDQSTAARAQPLPHTVSILRDPSGDEREVAVVSLIPLPGKTSLRATGGDDQAMPWLTIHAVPPPRLEQFHITITPPPYTRLPQRTEVKGVGHVEGYPGSLVEMQVSTSSVLSQAKLRREHEPPQTLPLTDDRTGFLATFTIPQEGRSSYWFELTDADGLVLRRAAHYEIHSLRDQPPRVEQSRPRVEMSVTPDAAFPVQAECVDDLGLASVVLRYSIDEQVSTVPLTLDTPLPGESPVLRVSVDQLWDLSPLQLQPGTTVNFAVEAVDNRPPEPQSSQARQRTLHIVTADDKRAELQAVQAGLARLIGRLADRQEDSRRHARDLATQWNVAQLLRPEDMALIEQLQLTRRRLLDDLTDQQTGVAAQLQFLQTELEWNRIHDTSLENRLAGLLQQTRRLADHILPQLSEHLQALAKAGRTAVQTGTPSESVAAAFETHLSPAREQIEHVTTVLRAMQAELGQSERIRHTGQEFERLLADQELLRQKTLETGRSTLGQRLNTLSSQQQATLAQLADQQQDLLTRFQAAREQLRHSADDSSVAQPRELLDRLTQANVEENLRMASSDLRTNRILEAGQKQQAITEALEDVLMRLSEVTTLSADARLAAIRQARDEAEMLHKRQEDQRQRLATLAPMTADADTEARLEILRKEQQELAQDTQRLAARLERIEVRPAAQSLSRASLRMQDAEQALARHRTDQAERAEEEGLTDLEQARRELAQAESRAAQEQAVEQLFALADQLGSLAEQQDQLLQETVTLDQARTTQGRTTRPQLRAIADLADRQQNLRQQVDQLARQFTHAAVIALVLQETGELMHTSASRLDDRLTDEATQQSQAAALRHLKSILDSASAPDESATDAPPADPGEAGQPSPETGTLVIELKLLRTLQSELMEETAALESSTAPESIPGEALQRLATRQKELAQMARAIFERLQQPSAPSTQPEARP